MRRIIKNYLDVEAAEDYDEGGDTEQGLNSEDDDFVVSDDVNLEAETVEGGDVASLHDWENDDLDVESLERMADEIRERDRRSKVSSHPSSDAGMPDSWYFIPTKVRGSSVSLGQYSYIFSSENEQSRTLGAAEGPSRWQKPSLATFLSGILFGQASHPDHDAE